MFAAWKKVPLYKQIFILLVIGAILGFVFGEKVAVFAPFGTAYIKLLKMLVVPLVFFSIISGVTKLASPKEFGQVGSRVISYYVVTTIIAAAIGVVIAAFINPGSEAQGMLGEVADIAQKDYSLAESVLAWIPENIVQSMATMDMIPIIIFAVLFGVCIIMVGEKAKPVVNFMDAANEVMLQMTNLVTDIAPYGIFFLAMQLTGTLGTRMLTVAFKFVLAVYVGLLVIVFVVYPIMLRVLGGFSPFKFYKNIFPVIVMAMSTGSSNASLPIGFECAGKNCGVPEKVYSFSLPLGATINMNGFAASLGIIAVTALELYSVPLTPLLVLQAVGMGLLLSIGAPGIQGTAVIMSAILFEALGIPMGMLALIAAIWPVVNIGTTTVNVIGDHITTCIVSGKLGMMDKDIFNAKR
ncbi:dicarboxylate/amino acid:cation symporter [uncultured Cloacibacillus sp.]|uniref:dicarboxylate/amino acid:cation symporter n=1 Tax=uncultured Cloacibacillus sp. TaxID=889794 RepID=UPI0025E9E017|nr:dicarboxylate/amino acid:cation symporter [uncultured Cloacibacillus sp.]